MYARKKDSMNWGCELESEDVPRAQWQGIIVHHMLLSIQEVKTIRWDHKERIETENDS